MERPKVGLGVIILREGKVLFGKRKGDLGGGLWCFPGGHLEFGESWEECARRETMEEAGIEIDHIRFVGATNDIFHDGDVKKHYITIFMIADYMSGEAMVMEPDRCEEWDWFLWDAILSLPTLTSIAQLLKSGYRP